jgi:DNA repair exonuclease SbcCD ATPase subunit
MLDVVSPAREAELAEERKQLEQRLGHLDETTYKRATDALRQRQDLFNQVRASSEKLESERQILLNTLESLRMRVVLAKGAGGQGDALGEMKREVDRLSEELSAITDALETVQKGEQQAIAPIESADPALAATVAPRERS